MIIERKLLQSPPVLQILGDASFLVFKPADPSSRSSEAENTCSKGCSPCAFITFSSGTVTSNQGFAIAQEGQELFEAMVTVFNSSLIE